MPEPSVQAHAIAPVGWGTVWNPTTSESVACRIYHPDPKDKRAPRPSIDKMRVREGGCNVDMNGNACLMCFSRAGGAAWAGFVIGWPVVFSDFR